MLLPFFTGMLVPLLSFRSRKGMWIYLETAVCINSALVLWMLFHAPEGSLTVFRFTGSLSVTLRLDGLGAVFAAIAALLWPLATLYAFAYMKQESSEKSFYTFYVITYGIALGVALAENILTMYFFFEMLSLVTLPLVMHERTKEAVRASRMYLFYMLGGAAFAFIGMTFVLAYGSTSSFVAGVLYYRGTYSYMHLFCPCIPQHFNNFAHSSSAHYTVVDKNYSFTSDIAAQRVHFNA